MHVAGRESVLFQVEGEQTLLDAAAAAGWELPHSCRRGLCETCRVRVVQGTTVPAPMEGTVLSCQAHAAGDLHIEVDRIEPHRAAERRRVRARLFRKTQVASDVVQVELRFPAGTRVPFRAGQYLHVLLEGQAPRSFSMANAPKANDGVHLHVRVTPGSLFGQQVLGTMAVGDELDLELPWGDFYLREGEGPVVLVAGGTGFAPLQSLLEDALGRFPGRSFTLYWGARDVEGLYAIAQVRKWERRHPNFRFVGVISQGVAPPDLREGLVHEAVLADYPRLEGHQVYACGSPAMVAAAREDFVHRGGLVAGHYFADSFAPSVGSG